MRKLKYLLPIFLMVAFTFSSCEEEEEPEPVQEEEQIVVNETSIIPSSTSGRPNNYLGCVEIGSRITSIKVWDHGTIDGDVVSIIANGNVIIDEVELDGPNNPVSRDYDFGFNGFNYVTLFAHNEGSISPNTCTVAINGVNFILEANLSTNGAIDVIVKGYGVDCSDAGGGSGGTGGGGTGGGGSGGGGSGGGGSGGGGPTTGDVKFWIGQQLNCGNVSINVSNGSSLTLSQFYQNGTSPSGCDDTSAGGNIFDLDPGSYSYSASCSNLTWSGSFNITAGGCQLIQLTN